MQNKIRDTGSFKKNKNNLRFLEHLMINSHANSKNNAHHALTIFQNRLSFYIFRTDLQMIREDKTIILKRFKMK